MVLACLMELPRGEIDEKHKPLENQWKQHAKPIEPAKTNKHTKTTSMLLSFLNVFVYFLIFSISVDFLWVLQNGLIAF